MIKILNEEEYKKFALNNEYISIYQIPQWGTLKSKTGWIRHLLGYYESDKLIGVTMLLEKKLPLKQSLYYTPRGYLVDVFDYEVLKKFHEDVIKYVKKNHGFMLKVDPNVIYQIRDHDGNIKDTCGEVAYQNFKKLGFKHMGFSKNFEDLQPRVLCRIRLKDTYDETLKTFSKSTRKNIDKTYDEGVRVKKIGAEDIDLFVSLCNETAINKSFIIRPASYYKRQLELMSDYTTIYLAYLDTNIHYNYVYKTLENKKEELESLEKEMKKINVGDKIKRKRQELEEKIDKLTKDLDLASNLKKSYKEINIGALMSVFIGNEGITFMSGTSLSYRQFNPKYAFYREHIIDSINKHLDYVNFYGISLDLDKMSKYYGIYEIKKGFNPEIVELIGEFDYVINPVIYYGYKIALNGYKILKKIRSCLKNEKKSNCN